MKKEEIIQGRIHITENFINVKPMQSEQNKFVLSWANTSKWGILIDAEKQQLHQKNVRKRFFYKEDKKFSFLLSRNLVDWKNGFEMLKMTFFPFLPQHFTHFCNFVTLVAVLMHEIIAWNFSHIFSLCIIFITPEIVQ